MAVGFDTPLGGLALEMAYRNEQARKKAAEQNAYEQALVNKRLQQYGGDIADYQDVWNRGYGGAQKAAEAQASALRDYWVGLPEAMVAVAREGQQTGGGGGGQPSGTPQLPTYDPKQLTDYISRLMNRLPPAMVGNTAADWARATSAPGYRQPNRPSAPVRAQRLR